MAKSKRKSGSSTDVARWETELAQGCLNEDDWKTVVLFAIPNQFEDVKHCNVLSESISTGLRKLFSVIEYESLIKEVKELAHGKAGKVKAAKPPPFIEIVDSIKSLVEQGEDIPPNLLAKLLKFKMLMIKQKDLDRREDEKKAAEAAAKQAKQDDRSRSKAGSSSAKRGKSQSPGRKKGKRDDAPPSPKKDTKLKRRGELEDTFKTIDDEPDGEDDPQHYIIITSIYEPRVFQPLIDLGVAVDGIIRVNSETYPAVKDEQNDVVEENDKDDMDDAENLDAVNSDEEEKRNEEKVKEKLQNFWKNIDKIIQKSPSGTKMKEIADLSFVVKDSIIPDGQLQEMEQERKTEYGTKIFEYTANTCYDLLGAKKRYKRYIENLKLTHVPSLKETILSCKSNVAGPTSNTALTGSTGLDPTSAEKQTGIAEVDMRYYNHLMDNVPYDAHSVPLLLDSLLRQVEATVDQKDPMNEPKPPRKDMLDHSLGDYLDGKLQQLGLKSPEIKNNEAKERSNEPIILHHGDERTRRIHHLKEAENVSPLDAEERIYDCHYMTSLIHDAMNDDHLEDNEKKSIVMRKQQLAHFCKAFDSQSKFEKTLTLMSLEVMPVKHVGFDEEVSSPCSPTGMQIGWDDPYTINPEVSLGVNEHSTDVGDENIKDLRILRNLSDYQYSEYFDSKTFPQVLDKAMDMRPYIDMYYHYGLSYLLLVLHNPRDNLLRNRKTWDTWLHSNVGFRNYLRHVAEEISLWQKDEDVKEEIRNMPEAPQTPPKDPTPILIKPTNRNQMMTRAEMLEMKEAEESKQKKKGGKSRPRSKSPTKRPASNTKNSGEKREKTSSSSKRTPSARKHSRAGTARKNMRSQERNTDPTEPPKVEPTEDSAKEYPFHGYDVSDELVHVSGETSYLFPRGGSLIKIESYDYIDGNKANRTTVYKDENVLVLNVKNPIINFDDPGKAIQTIEVNNQIDSDTAGTEKDSEKQSELLDLLKTIPTLPDLPEPICEESFMTISFSDGMRIGMESLTSKRLKGRLEALLAAVEEVKESVKKSSPQGATSSAPNMKTTSPKGRRNKEEEMRRQEEQGRLLEKENREKIQATIKDVCDARRACLRTSNLSVGCPDGLQLTFVHNEVKNGKVLSVRQEYVAKSKGENACEDERLALMKEESARLVTLEGAVIKYMVDGAVKILFPDGSVCTSPNFTSQHSSFPQSQPGSSSNFDTTGIAKSEGASPLKQHENLFPHKGHADGFADAGSTTEWLLVNAEGEMFRRTPQSNETRLNDIVISQAICPRTEQVVEMREDGVLKVKRPDGTVVVEHVDGTRITTYSSDVVQGKNSETGEDEFRKHDPVEFVKVECVGYATVLMNKKREEIKAIFGNGSEIRASINGEYQIQKPDSTRVFVNQKGEAIFAPKGTIPDVLSYEVGNLLPLFDHIDQSGIPTGVFLLKPSDINSLSTIDLCGNKFNVSHLGCPSTQKEEPAKESDVPEEHLLPRYFAVYKDGSAEELLREEDYSGFLREAEKDPMVAVLKPVEQRENSVTGITILRPFKGTNGEIWRKEKDEAEIIPPDLKERDFKLLQPNELKTIGPKFGSNAGVAFQIATKPVIKQPKPLVHCPKVLELRHIAHFDGLNAGERRKMIEGIENYRVFINEEAEREKGLLPSDPRSEEEKKIASQLYEKFKEMETQTKGLPSDDSKGHFDVNKVVDGYLEATKIPPSPPPEKAKPQRSLKEWEEDRIENAELKYAKEYLRSGVVPPYFDTKEGQRFLNSMLTSNDIEEIAADLAKETVHPSYRPASESSTGTYEIAGDPVSAATNFSGEFYDLRKSVQPSEDAPNSADEPTNGPAMKSPLDSKPYLSRPGNPTPAEVGSGDSGLGIYGEGQSRGRPFNPTPHHALKENSSIHTTWIEESNNETPDVQYNRAQQGNEGAGLQEPPPKEDNIYQEAYSLPQADFSSRPNEQESNGNHERQNLRFTGLNYTVTGEPRTEEVKIPASIRGSRPGAIPNQKFMDVEEPVRRQVKTASIAGTVIPESTSKLRGFHLLPDYVDFGVLKEGLSYSQTVMLKNVGIDTCRYRIKQPPPSTGLKVIYNPGPVAAGMAARLDVEIFAVAVGVEGSSGVGSIGHHIEIITESDALYLPVVATVLTSYEYENRSDPSLVGGPSKNTLLLSNRPSSRDALTRPRKI